MKITTLIGRHARDFAFEHDVPPSRFDAGGGDVYHNDGDPEDVVYVLFDPADKDEYIERLDDAQKERLRALQQLSAQ